MKVMTLTNERTKKKILSQDPNILNEIAEDTKKFLEENTIVQYNVGQGMFLLEIIDKDDIIKGQYLYNWPTDFYIFNAIDKKEIIEGEKEKPTRYLFDVLRVSDLIPDATSLNPMIYPENFDSFYEFISKLIVQQNQEEEQVAKIKNLKTQEVTNFSIKEEEINGEKRSFVKSNKVFEA